MNTKFLKDLTPDQVVEIAKLAYGSDIDSEIKVTYHPYDKDHLDDAQEFMIATFQAVTFGDKIDNFRLYIYPDLNVYLDAYRNSISNMTDRQKTESFEIGGERMALLGYFPVRNQYQIHTQFNNWKIQPKLS